MKTKLKKLNKGDTIGIISPAGAIKEQSQFNNAVKYFEDKGYKVKIAPHAKDQKTYLAGNDEDRLEDLENFFKDEEVKAILCSRGGYGTYRILDKIDFDAIRQNPKIFVGYSDITALLNNFSEKSGLITFHGPLFSSDFGNDKVEEYTEKAFWRIISGDAEIPNNISNPYKYKCINSGKAEGELVGGNLSIICGMLATPYVPDFSGKILFLEDVGEPLYKIDRMLTQLKLAGIFEQISGLLFAEFSSEEDSNQEQLFALDLFTELTSGLGIPVGYGFPAGHGEKKATLAIGANYFFDSEDFKLELRENVLN